MRYGLVGEASTTGVSTMERLVRPRAAMSVMAVAFAAQYAGHGNTDAS
jgi:hypothetical protein